MTDKDDLGLDLDKVDDQQGLSLEDLSRSYAEMLGGGEVPYQDDGQSEDSAELTEEQRAGQPSPESEQESAQPAEVVGINDAAGPDSATQPAEADQATLEEEEDVDLSPRGIVEAILFVGHPENKTMTSRQVAALMRGVRPAEIDDLVEELNQLYEATDRPMRIRSIGNGYRMVLDDAFSALSQKFHGKNKEARLSQAAVDVLSIVAYNQGIAREEIDQLRHRPSGALLNQLVQRQLLRLERTETRPRKRIYFTTQRFLDLFHLDTIEDLPQSTD